MGYKTLFKRSKWPYLVIDKQAYIHLMIYLVRHDQKIG